MIRALALIVLSLTPLLAAERTALLPFADYSANHDARDLVMSKCARILEQRGFQLVPQDSIAKALRKHRIRNTALPVEKDLKSLAEDLATPFILTGTIHRFSANGSFSEAVISARIIRADDGSLVWCNTVNIAGGGEYSLFSRPAFSNPAHLAKVAANKLLGAVTLNPKPRKYVTALKNIKSKNQAPVPCATLAVIPPTNEAEAEFASELIADLLVTELCRRGFRVVDPAKVRSVMLNTDDLRYGQSVEDVSRALADCLNVDLVLTGSVSELTDEQSVAQGTIPRAATELRLVNPEDNTVVWSSALERAGKKSGGFFGLMTTRSSSLISRKLIRDAVGSLRVVRARTATP